MTTIRKIAFLVCSFIHLVLLVIVALVMIVAVGYYSRETKVIERKLEYEMADVRSLANMTSFSMTRSNYD